MKSGRLKLWIIILLCVGLSLGGCGRSDEPTPAPEPTESAEEADGGDLVDRYNEGERDFIDAKLDRADLSEVNLSGADLSGAYLYGANLEGADLSQATLVGTTFFRANLNNADLRGANMERALLVGATLSEATYDDSTIWPDKYDPKANGAVKSAE
jgi:hypothetical protein